MVRTESISSSTWKQRLAPIIPLCLAPHLLWWNVHLSRSDKQGAAGGQYSLLKVDIENNANWTSVCTQPKEESVMTSRLRGKPRVLFIYVCIISSGKLLITRNRRMYAHYNSYNSNFFTTKYTGIYIIYLLHDIGSKRSI